MEVKSEAFITHDEKGQTRNLANVVDADDGSA